MSQSRQPQNDGGNDSELQDGDTVTDFTQFNGRLESKLNEIEALVDENDAYDLEVTYSPYSGGSDRVSLTIDSDECIANEGELGEYNFHIILGPRGGLKLATRHSILSGSKDYLERYSTISRAWSRLTRDIERAK